MKKILNWQMLLLVGILYAGVAVRYFNLGEHFAHIDDISVALFINDEAKIYSQENFENKYKNLNERIRNPAEVKFASTEYSVLRKLADTGLLKLAYSVIFKLKPHLVISRYWTYAPFQYFFTPFFISENQSYRDQLFWGRFPSFFFGALGFLLMPFFFLIGKKEKNITFPMTILGTTLLAFSWESIVYAKQMESYSIGIFSIMVLMLTLRKLLSHDVLTLKASVIASLILGALTSTQYQILFFIPAFYLAVFGYFLFIKRQSFKQVSLYLSCGGLCLLGLFLPVYFCYLRGMSMYYNKVQAWEGAKNSVFHFDSGRTMVEGVLYFFNFYVDNFIRVFQSNILFTLQGSFLAKIFIPFLLVLFVLGIWRLATHQCQEKRFIWFFFLGSMLTWVIFISLQRIALSPTRHSLILLPLMVICMAEGSILLWKKISNFSQLKFEKLLILNSALSLVIALTFSSDFDKVMEERKDPFDEVALLKLFEEYKVDTIIQEPNTINLSLMSKINKKIPVFITGWKRWSIPLERYEYQTVAYVGQHGQLEGDHFNVIRNDFLQPLGQAFNMAVYKDYEIIYQQEFKSKIEVEFTNYTKNGPNGFLVYILKQKNLPPLTPQLGAR